MMTLRPTTTKSSRPKIILAKGKARPIWAGHPWIYSGAIKRVQGAIAGPEQLVDVYDDKNELVGVGTYNPQARIAVRMLGAGLPSGGIAELILQRVNAAYALRQSFNLPSSETTAYRLLNGAGDRLPGVFCDILGELASIEITTAAAEQWLPYLFKAIDLPNINVRVPTDSGRMEGIAPGDRLGRGDAESHTAFCENGITWNIRPGKGQKTGFYTDQRENRRRVAQLAVGKRVLDCFCYTGGFSLNAARAGATEVVGVDSSGPAVSVASGTAKNNDIDRVTFHKEDAMRYLKQLGEEHYDIVVMDPPKLARSRQSLHDAYKKYRALNAEAIRHVQSGGFLVSCTCSSLVNEEMFLRLLTDAANVAGRNLIVHEVLGPGPDHPTPAAFPEGRYLTVVIASVTDRS